MLNELGLVTCHRPLLCAACQDLEVEGATSASEIDNPIQDQLRFQQSFEKTSFIHSGYWCWGSFCELRPENVTEIEYDDISSNQSTQTSQSESTACQATRTQQKLKKQNTLMHSTQLTDSHELHQLREHVRMSLWDITSATGNSCCHLWMPPGVEMCSHIPGICKHR